MSDIESVLADVGYMIALENKSPISRISKKIVLPDI